jgi:hypothetical protein
MSNIWADSFKEIRDPYFEIQDPYTTIEEKKNYLPSRDKDGDGDTDFADNMVARMIASGMSPEEAVEKTKKKSYNKEEFEKKTKKSNKIDGYPGKVNNKIDLYPTVTEDIEEASTSTPPLGDAQTEYIDPSIAQKQKSARKKLDTHESVVNYLSSRTDAFKNI